MGYGRECREEAEAEQAFQEHRRSSKRNCTGFLSFRENSWTTANKEVLLLKDMADEHVLNAYRKTDDFSLFKEMVIRMFEERIQQPEGYKNQFTDED